MKKLIALVLTGIMTVTAFAGCGTKEEPYTNPYSSMTLEEISAMLDFADSYKEIGISQTEYNEAWKDDFESAKQSLLTAWAEEITSTSENQPALKDGDTAKIDYKGILEGETEPFEGGSATDADLVLGSDSFIEGFEDGLIGKKVGDTVELKLTFPKDYSKTNLQNKKVTFTVTIKSAKSVPAYDDALIKKAFADNEESVLKYTTVKEYEDAKIRSIRANLAFAEYKNAVKVKSFPYDIVNNEYNKLMDYYVAYANSLGNTLESFVTGMYAYLYLGTTYSSVSDFADSMKSQAANQVKNSLLIYYVYNTNKSAIDSMVESETDRIIAEFADSYSVSIEEYKESYEEQALRDLVLEQLVFEFIGNQSKMIDDVKATETPEPTTTPTATPAATATATATADEE